MKKIKNISFAGISLLMIILFTSCAAMNTNMTMSNSQAENSESEFNTTTMPNETPDTTNTTNTTNQGNHESTTITESILDMDIAEFAEVCEESYNAVWGSLSVLNSTDNPLNLELEYLELNVEAAGYTYTEDYETKYISWRNTSHPTQSIEVKFIESVNIASALIKDPNKVYTTPYIHGKTWNPKSITLEDGSNPTIYNPVIGFKISEDGSLVSFVHNKKTYYTEVSNLSFDLSSANLKYALGLRDIFDDTGSSIGIVGTSLERSAAVYRTPDLDKSTRIGSYSKGQSILVVRFNQDYNIAVISIANGNEQLYVFISMDAFDPEDIPNYVDTTPYTGSESTRKEEDETPETPVDGDGGNNNSGNKGNSGNGNSGNSGNTGGSNYGDTDSNGNLVSNGDSVGENAEDVGRDTSGDQGSDGTIGHDYTGIRVG